MRACLKNTLGLSARCDFLYWAEREEMRKAVFERDPPFCVWCGVSVGDHRHDRPFTVDHIIPFSMGGSYEPNNLVLACGPCNSRRGNMSVLQYMVTL